MNIVAHDTEYVADTPATRDDLVRAFLAREEMVLPLLGHSGTFVVGVIDSLTHADSSGRSFIAGVGTQRCHVRVDS